MKITEENKEELFIEFCDMEANEEMCISKEAFKEAITKALTLYGVSTRLSQMITDIDNKTMNTTYDDGEHLAWDKDDIRCIQRTLQLLNE